jgi:hypothetical protein
MEQEIKDILIDFLKDSPYSETEKRDITLYIDGLKETEKAEFLDLMILTNKGELKNDN